MNIYEKLQDMTPEEFVEAAGLALGCLLTGCNSKDRFEATRPVIDGIVQMMKEGFTELLAQKPWEEAVWELLGCIRGN